MIVDELYLSMFFVCIYFEIELLRQKWISI